MNSEKSNPFSSDIDVFLYAKIEFSCRQMEKIRNALEKGLDF